MRILAVSDLRVQGIRMVERVADRVSPDLILYAGDDVRRFAAGPNTWSRLAQRTPLGLAGVVGNDCLPGDAIAFEQPGCQNLHERPLLLDGLAILGLEGAPRDECDAIGFTLYTQKEAQTHIARQVARAGRRKLLLVSHAPPRGILDTSIRFGPSTTGSSVVRSFADRPSARGIVCGHVHLQGGRSEQSGACTVVNVASHDRVGSPLVYGVLEWDGTHLRIVEIGREKDQGGFIGLVGVGTARAKHMARAGFRSLVDLLDAEDAALTQMFSRPEIARRFRARARALHTGSPVIIDPRASLQHETVIVDIETSLLQDDPWLVGYKPWGARRVHQLQELNPKFHKRHIRQVAKALGAFNGVQFLQWGPFDRGALRRAHAALGVKSGMWLHEARWTNAGAWLKRIAALPIPDYSLKSVAKFLGYEYTSRDLSGLMVGLWYQHFRMHGTPFDLRQVRAYNRDDVFAVEHVLRTIVEMATSGGAIVEPTITARRTTPRRKRSHRGWKKDAIAQAVKRYASVLNARVASGKMTSLGRARAIANYGAAMVDQARRFDRHVPELEALNEDATDDPGEDDA